MKKKIPFKDLSSLQSMISEFLNSTKLLERGTLHHIARDGGLTEI